jgi:ubiquinone/menaquinone biosynthesis C-methylase UbiE
MLNNISVRLAKLFMQAFPNYPTQENKHNHEIFHHRNYINGSEAEKKEIRSLSSRSRYEYEKSRDFFEIYFPKFNKEKYKNSEILEIGSYTGGSLVYWMERYGFSKGCGIDINPIFAEAGNSFANEKNLNATFTTGFGERLPYSDNSFDFIVSYDVFEHVQDLEIVMKECNRVLRPGGIMLAVFPPFFQPLEAHLTFVTKTPALQWIFSGQTLTDAYNQIIDDRGDEAHWYRNDNKKLRDWEKLPSLNGITIRKFKKIISKDKSWDIDYWGNKPILSDGRKAEMLIFKMLRIFFIIPARVPILNELFLGRICCVLSKKKN